MKTTLQQLDDNFGTTLRPHGDRGGAYLYSVGSILPFLVLTVSCILMTDHLPCELPFKHHTLLDHCNDTSGLNSQLVPWMNDGEVRKQISERVKTGIIHLKNEKNGKLAQE